MKVNSTIVSFKTHQTSEGWIGSTDITWKSLYKVLKEFIKAKIFGDNIKILAINDDNYNFDIVIFKD